MNFHPVKSILTETDNLRLRNHALSFALPFARRAERTLRPLAVLILARKP